MFSLRHASLFLVASLIAACSSAEQSKDDNLNGEQPETRTDGGSLGSDDDDPGSVGNDPGKPPAVNNPPANGGNDGGAPQATNDGGAPKPADAGATTPPGTPSKFLPSNLSRDVWNMSGLGDQFLGGCTLNTDTIEIKCGPTRLTGYRPLRINQPGGSSIAVFIAKSFRFEQGYVNKIEGSIPAALVAEGRIDILGTLNVRAGALTSGPGVGVRAANLNVGGGGGYCGRGGTDSSYLRSAGGSPWGTQLLVPLSGGSSGGAPNASGGGALQLVSGTEVGVGPAGVINAGGIGGADGGGGSGGSVLIESPTVAVNGGIFANGAGGGGNRATERGNDGQATASAAAGGGVTGGIGSAATVVDGSNATAGQSKIGSGGGAAGRVRINTASGNITINGQISPGIQTPCVSGGKLTP